TWKPAFYCFLGSSLGLLAFAPRPRVRGVLAIVISFYLCLTFVVRSLHPLTLFNVFYERFLDVTAPLLQLVNGLFIALAMQTLWRRAENAWWAQGVELEALGPAGALGLAAGLGLTAYRGAPPILSGHAMTVNESQGTIAQDTYLRNLPLVVR